FRQRVDQKLRLGRVVGRIGVHSKESQKPIDQVVDRWAEVRRTSALAAPAIETEAVILVFLKRAGIENAYHVLSHANRFLSFAGFPRSLPVERIDVLKNRDNAFRPQFLAQESRQMIGGQMGLAKNDHDERVGMRVTDFRNLGGGMAVARANLAQVLPRHAVQPINSFCVLASILEDRKERLPLIPPVRVKTYAIAQLGLVNFFGY